MTSRTIDIHCTSCRTYLFSLWPDQAKELEKDFYCNKKKCKEAATVDRLNGKVEKVEIVKQ